MADVFFDMKMYTARNSHYNKKKITKILTIELRKSSAITTSNSKDWIKPSRKRL